MRRAAPLELRPMLWSTASPFALACLLMLAGCGGGGGATAPVFKPPSYDYLTKLRLNVGDVRIEDQTPPANGDSDLARQSPVPPAVAMRKMAEDRLVAAGNGGTAVFTIDQASITGQPGGTLDGTLAAHLDIIGPSGGHNGYAEAHVSHQFVPGTGTDNDGLKSELYDLTNQMMSDMNVELEYQVRRTLGDWLLDASGAPVGAVVEQQSLSPAGASASGGPVAPVPASGPVPSPGPAPAPVPTLSPMPTGSNSVGAPMQLAPPPGSVPAGIVVPADPNAPGPTQLAPPPQAAPSPQSAAPATAPTGAAAVSSPPPGFLRLPNGYLVPSGAAPTNTPVGAPAGTTGQPSTPSGY